MGWKKWPSWLTGGIILCIIIVIFIVFTILKNIFTWGFDITSFQDNYFDSYIFLPLYLGFGCLDSCAEGITVWFKFIWGLITILATYFVIGALIGFIIGKIKSKNIKNRRRK